MGIDKLWRFVWSSACPACMQCRQWRMVCCS